MHRTVWTLLFALLLQLVLGSAWAMRVTPSHHPAPSCHETVNLQREDTDTLGAHAAHGKVPAPSVQADNHHCCAVGLGVGVQPQLLPLPQAQPASPHSPWASLSVRPDLRPPI